ncbi:hypothetical protein F2P81_019962 [Scophthalmus maximus]|uniref:Uncharacterized protein n=1 Tax=Scophthalmus maximus TaxID=52904 RepID=A0A6A4S7Z8_SCOMX|nr:hypothetical protein F2P81_019962 [Scophthalmus maximus]
MKRRVVKPRDSTSGVDAAQRTGGDRRKEGTSAGWWLKRGVWALFVVFILVLFSLRILPELIQHFVHTHRIRVPFFVDLSQPADLSLNHTINMYLTSEEGISLGVWHTVPESRWKEAQGKDLAWYQNTFSDGRPVFIYLHGNTGTSLKKMRSRILFLHSEDDHLVPIQVVQQMYKVAVSAQNAEQVKMVSFDGSLGYLHNGLYRDPHLPDILK